jgi:hypothetical protein
MDHIALSNIRRIAGVARKWAEHLAKQEGLCNKKTLDGLCARASAKLFSLLKPHYPCKIALTDCEEVSHVFIMCYSYIIDITATQFIDGCSSVEILHSKLVKENEVWWQNLKYFNSAKRLRLHQIKTAWPEEQIIQPEDLIDKKI